MSHAGTPKPETVEDKNLEQERDDTLGTGNEGLDDVLDPNDDLNDEIDGDETGGAQDREVPDDAGEHGTGGRAAEVRRPVSKQTQRVFDTIAEAKAAKAEAEAARREAAELRARLDGRQTAEDAALEREKIALMSPDERADYRIKKLEESNARQFAMLQFQTNDAADRSRFDAACARDTILASVADEVEVQLAEARRSGFNIPRETIAERILGQRIRQRASRAKPKQVRAGQERIARETVRAPNNQSNVTGKSGRTSDAAARAKRLENIEI